MIGLVMSKAVASTKRFQYHLFKRLENAVSRFQETTRPKKKKKSRESVDAKLSNIYISSNRLEKALLEFQERRN